MTQMTLSIGILGIAHGHVGTYLGEWTKLGSSEIRVAAIWDHDARRAADNAAKFNLAQEASAQSLLARSDISAVVIGAETSLHADLVELAAQAGKTIVLQKPLALTLDQADRIVRAVDQHRVAFTLAWQMRIDPQNILMRQLVLEDRIGPVYMMRRRHGLPTQAWPWLVDSWHVNPSLNRGMWADDSCHAIDFVYWMLGRPESVSAEIVTRHNPKVPDDQGIAVFRYQNGALVEVVSSFTMLAGENTTEIVGPRGVVIQNHGDVPSCNAPPTARPTLGLKWFLEGGKDWQVSDIPTPANHGLRIAALAPELLAFMEKRRGPIATAEEGRIVLEMTLACHLSAKLGRRVAISELRTHWGGCE